MSRDEINLSQIEQRLGKMGRGASSYEEHESQQSDDFDPDGSGSSSLNTGFIATVVGAFLAVGSGTFYFMDGSLPLPDISWSWASQQANTKLTSTADAQCAKGWRKDLPNVDQMHCYMTTSLLRLNRPEERDALVARIRLYEKDHAVWDRRLMMGTVKSIGKLQTQGLQIGLEDAKLHQPGLSDKEKMDQLTKVTDMVGGVMQDTESVLAESKNTVPSYQLQNDVRMLASKGYLCPKDFGRGKIPDWVKAGIAEVKKLPERCTA